MTTQNPRERQGPTPHDFEISQAARKIGEAARLEVWRQIEQLHPTHRRIPAGTGLDAEGFRREFEAYRQHRSSPTGRAEQRAEHLTGIALYVAEFGTDAAAGHVANARLHGASWAEIARAAGISKQAAHQRWSADARDFCAKAASGEYSFLPFPLTDDDDELEAAQ